QKRRAPFVWHVRQIWLRFVIGVLSFFAKVINPPTPFPPPASACFSPGPWQASHASPSVLLRGWCRKRRPILVLENVLDWSSWQPWQISDPIYPGGSWVGAAAGAASFGAAPGAASWGAPPGPASCGAAPGAASLGAPAGGASFGAAPGAASLGAPPGGV